MKSNTPLSSVKLLVTICFFITSILIVSTIISVVFTEESNLSLIIVGIFFAIVSIVCLAVLLKQIYLRKNWDEKNGKQEFEKRVDANVWNENQRLLHWSGDRTIDNPELDEKLGFNKEYILRQDKYGNRTITRTSQDIVPWIISSIMIVGSTIACVVGIITNSWNHIVEIIPSLIILGVLIFGDVFSVSKMIKAIKYYMNNKNKEKKENKKNKEFSVFYTITIIFFVLLCLYFIYSFLTLSINETILICLFVLYMISGLISFIIQIVLLAIVRFNERKNK